MIINGKQLSVSEKEDFWRKLNDGSIVKRPLEERLSMNEWQLNAIRNKLDNAKRTIGRMMKEKE